MHLSTRQLVAFVAVARCLSFTRAAERLNITQSALSQRIRKLEEDLGAALLIRAPGAVRLTATGQSILRFCEARATLEEEILAEVTASHDGELAGVVRVAAHSSILRPVLIPVLAPLLRAHPRVNCEMVAAEAKSLPQILKQGEAEFVIMDRRLGWASLTSHHLGDEVYVAIASANHDTRRDVYLDLDAEDQVTEKYFMAQRHQPRYHRNFMADVYGIIDGVAAGLGRAVVSRHLIGDRRDVRELPEFQPQPLGVYLHYYAHPYATRLHAAVREHLHTSCREFLAHRPDI